MLKSTILSVVAFMFVFVVWTITPVQAHIGEPCPHKNLNHQHCQNVINDLMIVDSSDPPKQVGKAGVFGAPVLSNNGQIYTLPLTRTGYRRESLKFESTDCGVILGDDALREVQASILPRVSINSPGNTLYLEKPGSSAVRTFLSDLDDDGVTCSGINEVNQNSVIMDPIVDLDTIFIPPFSIVGDAPSLPLP